MNSRFSEPPLGLMRISNGEVKLDLHGTLFAEYPLNTFNLTSPWFNEISLLRIYFTSPSQKIRSTSNIAVSSVHTQPICTFEQGTNAHNPYVPSNRVQMHTTHMYLRTGYKCTQPICTFEQGTNAHNPYVPSNRVQMHTTHMYLRTGYKCTQPICTFEQGTNAHNPHVPSNRVQMHTTHMYLRTGYKCTQPICTFEQGTNAENLPNKSVFFIWYVRRNNPTTRHP